MAQSNGINLAVHGMNCAACVRHVENALNSVEGVESSFVNLANAKAYVNLQPNTKIDENLLIQAIENKGFSAELLTAENELNAPAAAQLALQKEAQTKKMQFLIALVLSLPVFISDMGSHLIPTFAQWLHSQFESSTLGMMQFVLATLVILFPGRDFFTLGFKALFSRSPDMNSLVAVGAGSAWLYSVVALFMPQLLPAGANHLYFEAAAVVISLILLGKYLEARAKGQTGEAITSLLKLQSNTARVYRQNNWVDLPVDQINIGDRILVRAGEAIPIDALVLKGQSHVNESMVTGESMPINKNPGDAVIGGTINGNATLEIEATQLVGSSTLANIIRLVESAQATKLPVQNLVDSITAWFVPVVLVVAALVFLGWWLWGPGLNYAVVNAVAVLIVACPCAMGLAVPTSIMVSTGRAAQLGVLFRQGDALQLLAKTKIVAFDKTGTLTLAKPVLQDLYTENNIEQNQLLADLGSLQQHSEHPIATAIVEAAEAKQLRFTQPEDFVTHTGMGVSATVNGAHYSLGSARLMENQAIIPTEEQQNHFELYAQQGKTPVYIAKNKVLVGVLAVEDAIRPEAATAIQQLHHQGIKTAMITGDHTLTAHHVAKQLNIDLVYAQTQPSDKAKIIQQLQSNYGLSAFVGDGINDAPALAQADIGIAVGAGTDVAIESANIVLLNNDLRTTSAAVALSQATLRNIKQNLFWAFAYNVALIPLAGGLLLLMTGHVFSPIYSAIAMALSSVFVVTNALRLKRIQPNTLYS